MTKTNQSKQLSQVEFVLLQIIAETGHTSGYIINKLIEERGYREWADIGETSIYVGLDKLFNKDLAVFSVPTDKRGRGPMPKNFDLTEKGKETLKAEVLEALSATRENDRRFDLALAAVPFIKIEEVLQALFERKDFLLSEKERINHQFLKQGGSAIPNHVQLLFRHTLLHINAELEFTDEVIHTFMKTPETHHDHPKF
jgi:DNA-binding PadR family transcriptional regulator